MTLHHYRNSINYQDKIVINYRDIGFIYHYRTALALFIKIDLL